MKNIEKKPKYAMRKLSVGLVSCMLGFALVAGPSHALADEAVEGESTQVEEKQEEKDDQTDSETTNEIENDDQNTNDAEKLDIADQKEFESFADPQADEEKYMFDIRWQDKKLKEGEYVDYDPKLKGKEIDAQFCLEIVGKYEDENGNEQTETVYSNWVNTTLTIGKTSTIDIRKLKYKEGTNLGKYKSIDIISLTWPVHPYTGNYRWNLTDGSYDADNEHPNRRFTEINQSMSTRVEYEQEDKSIILDEDKDNINLKYNIKKKGSDELFKNPKRGDVVVTEEEKFTTKERNEWDKWLSTKRPQADDDSMNMAVRSAYLESFNRINNRKDREFELVVGFKGKDDQDTERLKKYYTLKIKGDDLKGWTVTLGSNLKEEKKQEKTIKKFDTKYIKDDSLDYGVEIVEKDGQDEVVMDEFNHIYLLDKNGNKETVRKKKIQSKKISELIDKIIRIGTRKPSPSIPEVKPEEDSPIIPLDPNSFRNKEDEEEYNRLVKELAEEIEKEMDKENPSQEKTDNNKEEQPSQEKTDDKKEEKPSVEKEKETDKKEENTDPKKVKKENKKSMSTPAKGKINPKTGVAGSGSIISILAGSIIASLGLRKKND